MKSSYIITVLLLILLVTDCTKKKHEEPEPAQTGAAAGVLFVYDTEYPLAGRWTASPGLHLQASTPAETGTFYTLTVEMPSFPASNKSYDVQDPATASALTINIAGSDAQQVFHPTSGTIEILVSNGTRQIQFANVLFESEAEAIEVSAEVTF